MAFAQGAQAGASAVLGRKNTRLREQELRLQERQDFTAQFAQAADETRANNLQQAQLAVEIIKSGGGNSEGIIGQLRKVVEANALSLAKRRIGSFGGNEANVREEVSRAVLAFDAAIQSALTPSQEAVQQSQAQVAGAQATAQSATEAGVPTTTESALVGQGIIPAPDTPNVINFQFPNGSIQAVDQNDDVAVSDAIRRSGRRISLAVQAESVDALTGVTKATPKEIAESKETILSAAGNIEEVKRSLVQFQETPQAGGVQGTVIETVGGFVQQLERFVGAGGTFENITGVDPAKVRGIRTDARALAASLLTTITKEESRFSNEERRIADEVLATLDAEASDQQIVESLRRALGMIERNQTRELSKFQAQAGISDEQLATREGLNALGEVLMKNGLTREQAKDALTRLIEARNVQLQGDSRGGTEPRPLAR